MEQFIILEQESDEYDYNSPIAIIPIESEQLVKDLELSQYRVSTVSVLPVIRNLTKIYRYMVSKATLDIISRKYYYQELIDLHYNIKQRFDSDNNTCYVADCYNELTDEQVYSRIKENYSLKKLEPNKSLYKDLDSLTAMFLIQGKSKFWKVVNKEKRIIQNIETKEYYRLDSSWSQTSLKKVQRSVTTQTIEVEEFNDIHND